MTHTPTVEEITSAPLRNRLRVYLEAPASEIWSLIGDLTRMPEYSAGLERVEVREDSGNSLQGYTCYFKPLEEGAERIVHREYVRWFEPQRGYASSGERGNPFGLRNDLNLVTLEPDAGGGTILTWEEYYDSATLEMNLAGYDQAFADIGENLIRRFGGRVLERFVASLRPARG